MDTWIKKIVLLLVTVFYLGVVLGAWFGVPALVMTAVFILLGGVLWFMIESDKLLPPVTDESEDGEKDD